MTNQISRRQILKLGAAAPVVAALSAIHIPASDAVTTASPDMTRPPIPNMVPSRKKGVGVANLVSDDPASRVTSMNPAWYYTWAADGISGVQNVEFVPMVWGGEKNIQTQIGEVQHLGRQPVVLGPNEPDNPKQSNMSVSEVLQYWPEITDLAALTVAPAPVHPFDSWITDFLQQATGQLRPNYFAVHAYPGAVAGYSPRIGQVIADFLREIDQVYQTYGLPIWITEFAVADWTAKTPSANIYSAKDVLEFMQAVLPDLESRPYVARYAWFGAGPAAATSPALGPSALFDSSGNITPLGEYYAQFGVAAASPVQAGGVERR